MADEQFKRHIAYKLRVGDILSGKVILDEEKFKCLEYTNKTVVRVNLIANITDKYIQDGEKKFASITLDDATGQIKAKTFGDDIEKLSPLSQGDTIQIIGLLRSWNNEIYILPEIVKKKDSKYLLVRKLESDIATPKTLEKTELQDLKAKILEIIKKEESNSGAEVESIILELKSPPAAINQEIKKLLEEGIIYEPRPGKVRHLG